ncbi:Glu/Leu/Phe/Val dehydrogenase dimerization domain-containing protein, partial [Siminovitchia fortis]|uniref:Glu/Leu/Phe/Val dehydrogenase dimerization domain-containing protein n=1 Tax=Siminovitchia fortis TaxID=254758 RepID=UPI0036F3C793
MNDKAKVTLNRPFPVQFNPTLPPYKRALTFHPSLNPTIINFFPFQQLFNNPFTNHPIPPPKRPSHFHPKPKSHPQIITFTQTFITQLTKYIG